MKGERKKKKKKKLRSKCETTIRVIGKRKQQKWKPNHRSRRSNDHVGARRRLQGQGKWTVDRIVVTNQRSLLPKLYNFYSTTLPLKSTWWVRSTFSSHCPLSSNQHHWLNSATATIYSSENLNVGSRTRGPEASSTNAFYQTEDRGIAPYCN